MDRTRNNFNNTATPFRTLPKNFLRDPLAEFTLKTSAVQRKVKKHVRFSDTVVVVSLPLISTSWDCL